MVYSELFRWIVHHLRLITGVGTAAKQTPRRAQDADHTANYMIGKILSKPTPIHFLPPYNHQFVVPKLTIIVRRPSPQNDNPAAYIAMMNDSYAKRAASGYLPAPSRQSYNHSLCLTLVGGQLRMVDVYPG